MKFIIAATSLMAVVACSGSSREIENACLASKRANYNRALCSCIQQAADRTLSVRDQKRAVAFFKDPHKAQEMRQSSRSGDSEFWTRYRAFGTTAEAYCS